MLTAKNLQCMRSILSVASLLWEQIRIILAYYPYGYLRSYDTQISKGLHFYFINLDFTTPRMDTWS